jgi:hypothetical protein
MLAKTRFGELLQDNRNSSDPESEEEEKEFKDVDPEQDLEEFEFLRLRTTHNVASFLIQVLSDQQSFADIHTALMDPFVMIANSFRKRLKNRILSRQLYQDLHRRVVASKLCIVSFLVRDHATTRDTRDLIGSKGLGTRSRFLRICDKECIA